MNSRLRWTKMKKNLKWRDLTSMKPNVSIHSVFIFLQPQICTSFAFYWAKGPHRSEKHNIVLGQ
ncbi:hypothetical protein EJ08DRAFT_77826 [Tothia fuscella]|uniref:Uncharacterized protein n=1 Tax=Tothia fuscella TaxID=1048955 RepID=A0A9P4U152_9PEZI|nr:hypothetical protein EJ08DRAFT_77826 [Tothia fuscella]